MIYKHTAHKQLLTPIQTIRGNDDDDDLKLTTRIQIYCTLTIKISIHYVFHETLDLYSSFSSNIRPLSYINCVDQCNWLIVHV